MGYVVYFSERHLSVGKEAAVATRVFPLAIALVFVGAVVALVGWGVTGGSAQGMAPDTGLSGSTAAAELVVGRYQAAAPDLVLDTATGRLAAGNGQMLEPPIDAGSTEAGRFSAAGYVTAVTRGVGIDVMQQPAARTDLVKGYVIVDTKTGRVAKSRVYESRPLQPGDL